MVRLVRLGDVARVEIGAESYGVSSRYNGQPAAGFAINLATGANAIDTAGGVASGARDQSAGGLPTGVEIVYPYDTTPFVKLSIEKVVETLIEAIVLVFVVMFVFLQNFRATLIPMIAVPVVLLGTFGVLSLIGYSINTLTMFAMVLAIGLLVDDAIVVVENVERVMAEEGLSPLEATRKVDGRDHRRADRHRAGAVGRVRADGVFRRLGRRHLSAVLGHHRLGDGAVGAGRDRADAGALRHHAEADRPASKNERALRLVQPRLRHARTQRLSRRRRSGICSKRPVRLLVFFWPS